MKSSLHPSSNAGDHVVTIKHVAKHAGVSVSTVSRVMNDREHVSAKTRLKVLRAVDELGYQPNLWAQSLVRGQFTRELGLLVYDISNTYFAEIAKAFEGVAYRHDYTVILCSTAEDTKTTRYLDMFTRRRTDGVAIVGCRLQKEDIARLELLLERGVPIVLTRERGWDVNPLTDPLRRRSGFVEVDTFEGARAAVSYLISQGHRRIGALLTVPRRQLSKDPRTLGYQRALEEHGIPLDDQLIVSDLETSKSAGGSGMKELLRRGTGCTAVFAYNDLIAIGALATCRWEGLRVPEDFSIVSIDDIEDSLYTSPPLTTVRIPRKEQGEFMASYLLSKVNGGHPPSYLSLPIQLSLRQSVAPMR